jgi:hypothetical protein
VSIISKSLSGIIFNGAALALASAPWKNNVRAIYGFNGQGNGYTVFKPASTFNSLTQLSQDGVYIVDTATPGFELPGATLTTTSPVASVPKLTIIVHSGRPEGNDSPYLRCLITSSDASDKTVNVLLSSSSPAGQQFMCLGAGWLLNVPVGQLVDLPTQPVESLGDGDSADLFAVAPSGATGYQQFVMYSEH